MKFKNKDKKQKKDISQDINENNGINENEDSQGLIIANEVFPKNLTIIPLFSRPIFPGMMVPLILTGTELVNPINDIYKNLPQDFKEENFNTYKASNPQFF
jgi:hypothetical protein